MFALQHNILAHEFSLVPQLRHIVRKIRLEIRRISRSDAHEVQSVHRARNVLPPPRPEGGHCRESSAPVLALSRQVTTLRGRRGVEVAARSGLWMTYGWRILVTFRGDH